LVFVDGLTHLHEGDAGRADPEHVERGPAHSEAVVLRDARLQSVEAALLGAVRGLKGGGKTLLVLDGLDFLLGATGATALQVMETIGELREVCRLPPALGPPN
jgi:hypothetical protein